MWSELPWWLLLIFALVGTVAGFVDTLAGGGGMLTFPTFLLAGLPPDAALATNKMQGCVGTLTASRYFWRRGDLSIQQQKWALLTCVIGAALGTTTVQFLPTAWLARVIPFLLLLVALLFLFLPRLGELEQDARHSEPRFLLTAALPIAFYDGFLGPGTGSFFLVALILLRGRTLQQATITAKLYNATTNLVALSLFLLRGKIVWLAALAMASGQIIGAHCAARMVIQRGNRLIRPVVIIMSALMSGYLLLRTYFL